MLSDIATQQGLAVKSMIEEIIFEFVDS